jgi:hypothetical protein
MGLGHVPGRGRTPTKEYVCAVNLRKRKGASTISFHEASGALQVWM